MRLLGSRRRRPDAAQVALEPQKSQERDYTLALEEARRGFDQQFGEVTNVRNRAASLLGMGGLAASFLSSLALRDGAPRSWFTGLAIGAFATLAVLAALVLWRRRFYVSQRPETLVQWVEDVGASKGEMTRDLALWLGRKYEENRKKIDRMGWLLSGCIVAFVVEVTALLLDQWGR